MRLPEAIHTARLTLRPFEPTDGPAVLDFSQDEDWAAYQQTVPRTAHEAEQVVADLRLRSWNDRPVWAITRAAAVVGLVSLGFEANHRIALLGYGIHRAHRGLGLTSEAVDAVLGEAFAAHPQLARITAHTDARNRPSSRLLEKLGFVREGTLRSGGVTAQGELVDAAIYGLLRSERRAPSR
jgi:[ribosomal protein S5]-alanine N-acetyltransferase